MDRKSSKMNEKKILHERVEGDRHLATLGADEGRLELPLKHVNNHRIVTS